MSYICPLQSMHGLRVCDKVGGPQRGNQGPVVTTVLSYAAGKAAQSPPHHTSSVEALFSQWN